MTMTVTSSGAISWGTASVITSATGGRCNPVYNLNYPNKSILGGMIKTANSYVSTAGLSITGTSITVSNFSDGNINGDDSSVESGGNTTVYSNYSGQYCFVNQSYPSYSRYTFATTTDGLSVSVSVRVITSSQGSNQYYAGACTSDVDGVVVENHNDRSSSSYYSYYCFNPTFNFTTTAIRTNLTAGNLLGFAQDTVSDNQDVKVKIVSQTDANQTGLTTATQYFVNNTTGDLQTAPDSISVVGGTALSSTKILIKS
jgi:hypothetical protein